MLHKILRWVYRISGLLISLLLVVLNVRLYQPNPYQYGTEYIPPDAVSQLNFLREALVGGAGEEMQSLFPEGYFFTHVLYGLSWVQIGLRDQGDLLIRALHDARWALDRLDTPQARAPFSSTLNPPYGVFYVGWKNWLRGGILLLDQDDTEEQAHFEQDCAALAKSFQQSTTPFLSAYPGQSWPVDNVVGIAVLRLHDHLLTPRYQSVISRWLKMARERLDPVTGLLPHSTDPITGKGDETAWGSSQSVILRFLPEIDATWADEQYRAFRQQFVGFLGTVPGIREYPQGTSGHGDVDSGPLINGLSASATVVTPSYMVTANLARHCFLLVSPPECLLHWTIKNVMRLDCCLLGMGFSFGRKQHYLGLQNPPRVNSRLH